MSKSIAATLKSAAKPKKTKAPPHLMISARAGTGKTTTLVEGLKVLKGLPTAFTPSEQQAAIWESLALSKDARTVCFVAFNKSIASELASRIPAGCEAMTMHSMGFKAVNRALPGLRVNEHRVTDLIAKELGQDIYVLRREKAVLLAATKKLVGLVKMNLAETTAESLIDLASHYEVEMDKFQSEILALVPKIVERCRDPRADGCLDFDDMVWLPVALDLPMFRYDLLLVDEAQDLNRCQQAVAKKCGTRLVFCGDEHQCQPSGTMVRMSDGTEVPIESLKEGDRVITYDRRSAIFVREGELTEIAERYYSGWMYSIFAGGKFSECTDSHKWMVRWTNKSDTSWVTYLMKQGTRFRVGQTQMFRKDGEGNFGLSERARVERAEAAWILKVHETYEDALAYEQILSVRYGIPEMVFYQPSNIKYFTQEVIDRVFNELGDLTNNANKCLTDHRRLLEYPIYTSANYAGNQSRRGRTTIFETQACNLISGYMAVGNAPSDINSQSRTVEWETLQVESVPVRMVKVYSLNIEKHHKYISDGIVTCNSIYGFAGADSESMARMAKELSAAILPLTVTRRCGKAIVAEAKRYVPDFSAFDTNPEGVVRQALYPTQPGAAYREKVDIGVEKSYLGEVRDGDFVVCRSNAPLVNQCFKMIRLGKKATIQGRDVGQGLISLVKKLDARTIPELVTNLSRWFAKETDKEQAKKNPSETKLQGIEDKYECLMAFVDGANSVDGVVRKIEELFTDRKDQPGVRLSSIHKAKGLESRRVYFLRPAVQPVSQRRKKAWAEEQELNLVYVAVTRAIEELVLVY